MLHAARQQIDATTDDELLSRVVRRDNEAFEELYRRHAAAVVAITRQFTHDSATADEATQAAFFALWERASRLEGNSRLRAWLATVARNDAIDKRRRKRLQTISISPSTDRASEERGPEEHAIVNERSRSIRVALHALTEDQRRTIELAYFGGLSQTEIAELLGEPLGTIKSRVRLAMQRLRSLMVAQGAAL